MDKKASICQRIIFLSEQIACHKKINDKLRHVKYLYSRLASVPPSTIFFKEIEDESKRTIEEMEQTISKLMKPLMKGISFDMDISSLSSRDIYRGYIELYDSTTNKQYILFFKSFNNGLFNIEEGSLELNDRGQLEKVLEDIKPIKKTQEAKTLFDVIMNQK